MNEKETLIALVKANSRRVLVFLRRGCSFFLRFRVESCEFSELPISFLLPCRNMRGILFPDLRRPLLVSVCFSELKFLVEPCLNCLYGLARFRGVRSPCGTPFRPPSKDPWSALKQAHDNSPDESAAAYDLQKIHRRRIIREFYYPGFSFLNTARMVSSTVSGAESSSACATRRSASPRL